MELSDSVLQHLKEAMDQPDLSGTRYTLEGEIGRGGLGVVYRAWDRQLNRAVALKITDAEWAEEPRLIARLEHPAIVPVYEAGELPDGRVFYAMKLVEGSRLDEYAAGGRSIAELLRVMRRVGEALAYAHGCSLLHRDLKPQNVMVGAFGEVYVMDWGVAGIAGTPPFRAPETELDARSDVYALGALLRTTLPAAAPRSLAAIADRAMRPEACERYADVNALLADLERFQEGSAVAAYTEPVTERLRRFAAKNGVLLGLLGAYAGVKVLLFFWPRG